MKKKKSAKRPPKPEGRRRKGEKPPALSAANAAELIALHTGSQAETEELEAAIAWRYQMLLIHDKEEDRAPARDRAKLWGEVCSGRATEEQRKRHERLLHAIRQKAEKQIRAERKAEE
jgi:hypothetical protein